jgi:hypothetical protein
MNPEKLRKMQEQVRTGGKGSVRRKRKVAVKSTVRRTIAVSLSLFVCVCQFDAKRKKGFFFFFFIMKKKNNFFASFRQRVALRSRFSREPHRSLISSPNGAE